MARYKTFANNGLLTPPDLNAIQDDYEATFSKWRTIAQRNASFDDSHAAGTIIALPTLGSFGNPNPSPAVAGIDIDPADYAASPRTCKARLRVFLSCNSGAPSTTITANIAAATITHNAGNDVISAGTTQASVVFPSTPASSLTRDASPEFTPAAGIYVISVVLASQPAVACQIELGLAVQVRAV